MNGSGQMQSLVPVEVPSSADVWGKTRTGCISRHSDSNIELRLQQQGICNSAIAADQISVARHLCLLFMYCPVLP